MIIIINIIREKRSIVQQKDWMSWYPVIQSHQPPRQTLWRDGHIDTDVHGTRFSVLFESTTVITPSSVLSTYHDGIIDTDVHGTRFSVLFESTTVITTSYQSYLRRNGPEPPTANQETIKGSTFDSHGQGDHRTPRANRMQHRAEYGLQLQDGFQNIMLSRALRRPQLLFH